MGPPIISPQISHFVECTLILFIAWRALISSIFSGGTYFNSARQPKKLLSRNMKITLQSLFVESSQNFAFQSQPWATSLFWGVYVTYVFQKFSFGECTLFRGPFLNKTNVFPEGSPSEYFTVVLLALVLLSKSLRFLDSFS